MAARFLVSGGTGNWNSTTNWSATSGGAAGASFPIAGDDVTLDNLSASAPITVNVASAALTFTVVAGYAGTVTVTNTLTLTSHLTLVTGVTVAGAGGIVMNGTATVTTNGITIGCALSLQGAFTYTLVDNFQVNGLLSLGSGSSAMTMTGAFTITAAGGMTHAGVGSSVNNAGAGTIPTVRISATGTITAPNNTTANFRINLTIDAGGGTVTFFNGIFSFGGGTGSPTFTYTSGTVVMAGSSSALQIQGTCTLTTAGIVWNKVNTSISQTVTLTNDLTMTGLFSPGTGTVNQVWNGATVNCGGGIRIFYTTGSLSGTTVIMVTGAGALDTGAVFTGRITNPFTINAPGAAITMGTTFALDFSVVLLLAVGSITNANAQAWVFPTSGGSSVLIGAVE